jgi:predicted dehydrogenase
MVVSLAEMDAIESATAASGVTVFEAFMYLHHPQTLRVIELIRSGRIGQMQEIQSWFQYYLPPTDSSNVRLLADLTGGAHWDVGVYPNSFSIVATGGKAPLDVWAQSLIGETGVDVGMRAQLRFANGVTSQISCGFRTPFREAAWFVGDQGIIHVAEPWKPGFLGQESRITLSDRNDRVETIVIPPTDPYDCEVAAMEACVLDGAAPVVPLGLSREFAKSILAAYSSAATGLLTVP